MRTRRISNTNFAFNLNSLTDNCCLSMFSFTRENIEKLITIFAWPYVSPSRNRYRAPTVTVLCIIFSRMTTPHRWKDSETLFGQHASQISELLREGLEHFTNKHDNLLTGPIEAEFVAHRSGQYATAVYQKSVALDNCIGLKTVRSWVWLGLRMTASSVFYTTDINGSTLQQSQHRMNSFCMLHGL